jgi:hypothetical protein
MRARLTKTALVALVALTGLAASCFEITDPFVVAVNVNDIRNTYNVTPGTTSFGLGCVTKNPGDYIDPNFEVSGGGQLVDVIVEANGTFGGNILNGQVGIGSATNAQIPLVTYSGPWSAFNAPQSLLQDNGTLTLNPTAVTTMMNLIQNRQPIVICHGGVLSQPAVAGMSIDVTILAQVNATP